MKNLLTQILILALFTLIACLMLYPLPFHLTDGLVAAESGDPLLQIWVVQWNIHKWTSSLANYFDANIFYPYSNTFAFHDHLFGISLLGLPVQLISHNPILTYNLLLISSFVLSAYSMFLLCRELTGHTGASLLGGFIFGFLPYRFAHLDHLNLLHIQWLPLCLLFLTRILFPPATLRRATLWRDIRLIGLFWFFYLLQVLSSFNYLFMLTFAIGIFIVAVLFFQWKLTAEIFIFRSKRRMIFFLLGACMVGIIVLPFGLPYLKANHEMGFQRTIQEAESLSARMQDYLVAPENNLLYGKITRTLQSSRSPFPREQILFGGILPVILAGFGIFGSRERRSNRSSQYLAVLRQSYLVLFGVAGVLSLGPFWRVGGYALPLPYLWLYRYVPGFQSMRVPARFGILVFFVIAIAAALGSVRLLEWCSRSTGRGRKMGILLSVFLWVGLLLEYGTLPKHLTFYPSAVNNIPPVYRWLAMQPEDSRVIEFPLDSAKSHFEAAYYSTFHWKRIVNGRSAFIPRGIEQLWAEMRQFPSPRPLALLKALGIDTMIVHIDRLSQPLPQPLPAEIRVEHRFGADRVLTFVEETPGLWQQSGAFIDSALSLSSHIPQVVRSGAETTIGVTLTTVSTAFSPLPYEHLTIGITWETLAAPVRRESQRIPLPVLLLSDSPYSIPLTFHAPEIPGTYTVVLHSEDPLLAQQSILADVTVSSDIPDSRQPGVLRAQCLQIDLPDVWERGKSLPVRLLVKNSGDTIWKARMNNRERPAGEVRAGVVYWQEVASGVSLQNTHPHLFQMRGFLPYDVAPGEETFISMQIDVPDTQGEYRVQFGLVSELIRWFPDLEGHTFTKTIVLH